MELVTPTGAEQAGDVLPFPARFAVVRERYGPLVFGLDPSGSLLEGWGLGDDPDGLERFVDLAVQTVPGAVGLAKPQSAFYERHGWRGIRALSRLVSELRQAGVLVVLDVKRGDVGSTNDAYAEAYLGKDAALPVDAMTLTPYLGLGAMESFLSRASAAGAGLFVVIRSTNPEGRIVQEAVGANGLTVEQALVAELGILNRKAAGDGVGPYGAVFGPTHAPPPDIDLAAMNGLFLAPGVGAQGATAADVAACFAVCPARVLPAASRSLLAAGPDVAAMRDAAAALSVELRLALGI